MGFSTVPCNEFVEVLASKAPVPGGGGASALVGAIGTELGNMVGSLTVGKKKYADVEAEMQELKAKCDVLQKELLTLVEKDEVSLEDKMEDLKKYAAGHRHFSFRGLLTAQSSKVEVIVTFLAILELMKMGTIRISQEHIFDDIQIDSKVAA